MPKSEAAARRLRAERSDVAAIERRDPLRRRLLIALGDEHQTPTALTEALDTQKEQVSRALADLRNAGLVTVSRSSNDRRQRIYALTAAGCSERNRHLAFGETPEPPDPPGSDEIVAFMREALSGAVRLRRRENRLQDAIDRIEEIYRQAEEEGARDLALEALAELAATQRQAGQHEARRRSLATLEGMAFGAPGVESQRALPAIAHLEYERGKAREPDGSDTPGLAPHLVASMTLFEALFERSNRQSGESWLSRQAWSIVGLARNRRDRSDYEDSLQYAASGLRIFEDLDDDYGRAQCWFDFGFCLRLLRRFDAAWECLEHVHRLAIAPDNRFERTMAHCLVQMGEVRRCQSRTDEAKELLNEALDAGKGLDLGIVRALATSAMAAVEFQANDLERARATLRSAQRTFARYGHHEGAALNARRQATVARHLSNAGVTPDEPEARHLIGLAEKTYRKLDSPAGVAACEIERGWMEQVSPQRGDREEVVQSLHRLIKGERRVLRRDAWVPYALCNFAKEVGGDLAREARAVYSEAERHLEEEASRSVRRVAGLAGQFDEAAESLPSPLAMEMGGESRRRRELFYSH